MWCQNCDEVGCAAAWFAGIQYGQIQFPTNGWEKKQTDDPNIWSLVNLGRPR